MVAIKKRAKLARDNQASVLSIRVNAEMAKPREKRKPIIMERHKIVNESVREHKISDPWDTEEAVLYTGTCTACGPNMHVGWTNNYAQGTLYTQYWCKGSNRARIRQVAKQNDLTITFSSRAETPRKLSKLELEAGSTYTAKQLKQAAEQNHRCGLCDRLTRPNELSPQKRLWNATYQNAALHKMVCWSCKQDIAIMDDADYRRRVEALAGLGK